MEHKNINCPHCGRIIPMHILEGKTERPKVTCPDCGSKRNCKNGMRQTNTGRAQTYLCQDCGRRFTSRITSLKVLTVIPRFSALVSE